LSPILFNLSSKYLTKEALEGFGDFKIAGQVIHTLKYVVVLVLLTKKETAVLGKIDTLPEVGICYGNGMDINVEKTMVIGICRQSSPIQIMTDRKQWENLEYFKYLSSLLTNAARCACKIKSRIAIQQEKDSFNQQN
jgi:hypothetical protein